MDSTVERRFYLREFKAISRAISTYEDISVLTEHLAEGASRAFKSKGCIIMLADEREQRLFPVSSYGISEAYLRKGPVIISNEHCAYHTGEPVLIENMQNDPRVQYPEAAAQEGIVSMLSIPIKTRKVVTGLLRLYHSQPLRLHEDDVDSLCVLAQQLGLVIEYNGLKNFLDRVKISMESLPPRMLEER